MELPGVSACVIEVLSLLCLRAGVTGIDWQTGHKSDQLLCFFFLYAVVVGTDSLTGYDSANADDYVPTLSASSIDRQYWMAVHRI